MNEAAINNMFVDVLHSDFKAEVIAANMVENGIPIDRILIEMLGGNKRSYRKDVEEIIEEQSDYDRKDYYHIMTHKEGIYDMLPEGLFHRPTLPKSVTTQAEIIKALKKHHEEEKTARSFFLPFEAAINDQRIQTALNENLLDIRLNDNKLVAIFAEQWEIFKYLDARQSNVFLFLLPLLHDLRDKYDVASILFELILLIPVTITLQPQQPIRSRHAFHSTLDNSVLGVNFTTGNDVFETGDDEILIRMGPMPKAVYAQYMPGGDKAAMFELLCDHFLPAHLDVKHELLLEETDKATRLADGINPGNSTLGSDTYL